MNNAVAAALGPLARAKSRGYRCLVTVSLAAASVVLAQTNGVSYRMVPWAEVSDRSISELARFVREQDTETWYYAESAHFIVYAHSIRDADAAIRQAEYAWEEIGRLLEVVETGRKAHLILIDKSDVWDRLVTEAGMRPDGLAFQNGREIFIKATSQIHVSRIPHEVVHFRLRDSFGDLPLWLDEGLALQYGWRVAKTWAAGQGQKLTRTLPAVSEANRLSLDALTAGKEYPADVAQAQAYYREAEELTVAIVERIGLTKAGAFLKAAAGDKRPWRVALVETFGLTDEDMANLEAMVGERAGQPRDD